MSRLDTTTDCKDCEQRIREEALEELGKTLCEELEKGYVFMNKHQILHFVEQLKEQK